MNYEYFLNGEVPKQKSNLGQAKESKNGRKTLDLVFYRNNNFDCSKETCVRQPHEKNKAVFFLNSLISSCCPDSFQRHKFRGEKTIAQNHAPLSCHNLQHHQFKAKFLMRSTLSHCNCWIFVITAYNTKIKVFKNTLALMPIRWMKY